MIALSVEDGVAHLTLGRTGKRNALTPEMLEDIASAPARVGPEARCLLLTGEGSVFCAGFDLPLCRNDLGALRSLLQGLSDAVTALRETRLPVIACAHGAAVAGGCALLAGADVVVADAACKLGYPVLRLGISPAVSAPTLAARIGAGAARARLLDTQLVTGEDALRLGLVHHLASTPDDARALARRIATEAAAKPPHGLAATKRWLNELDGTGPEQIRRALEVSLSLTGSAEQQERLAALWT